MLVLIHRFLVLVLALCWAALWHGGLAIFRQKKRPDVVVLPRLVGRHAALGVLWALFLVADGLVWGAVMKGASLSFGLSLLPVPVLAAACLAVLCTGHGLKTGKPRGAFVHVGYALLATAAALALALQNLWYLLP